MDSANLSESQSNQLNFRNTASNTTPFLCPCGGFNEYAQVFPQAYCSRPLNPGQSKCTHSQDAEEKFPMQQHIFPNIPFVSPIFYNSPFTNLYCPHNASPETLAKEQQKQSGNEPKGFSQKEKCCRPNYAGEEGEDAPKNNFQGPEVQFLGHPFCCTNLHDPIFAPSSQRCGCGNSLPWTCSSFIVPIISYCVFWNSRQSNLNMLSGDSVETCQRNKETGNLSDKSKEIPSSNSSQVNDFNNNLTENVEDCLEVIGDENPEWESQERAEDADQETIRSFKSLTLSSEKENGSDNAEESDKNEGNLEAGSDGTEDVSENDEDDDDEEEGEDGETYDWADEEKNEEDAVSNTYNPNGLDGYTNDPETRPSSASESYADLQKLEKAKEPEENCSSLDVRVDSSDNTAEGEKGFRSRKTKDNVQENLERQKTHVKKELFTKKFINNFTMTDQTSGVHEEAQTTTAAAGDLGGVHCLGYKINISGCYQDRELEIVKKTIEHVQTKEIFVKEASNSSPKLSEKTTKNLRQFKSGIAKLMNNPKVKELRGDPVKSTQKEAPVQKEPPGGKRKHNCFPTETTTGAADSGSYNQKTRNYRLIQGVEKQQKSQCVKTETLRKGEKNSKVKLTKETVKK